MVEIIVNHAKEDPDKGEVKILKMTNKDIVTALHEAVWFNHLEVVRLLTKEDLDFLANLSGETPLYLAVERSFGTTLVTEILQNCKSPAHGGPSGRTALHATVINYDTGGMAFFDYFKRVGNVTSGKNPMGSTSRLINVEEEEIKLYKAALEGEIGAFKDYKGRLHLLLTPNKNTLLHIHITAQPRREKKCTPAGFSRKAKKGEEKKSTRFVEEILSMCPQLLRIANANHEIPLHLAARYGSSDIVQLLIKRANTIHDADPENGDVRQMLRMITKEEDTALHEAVRVDHIDVVKLLTKEDPDLSNSVNVIGKTPLYLAAERGSRESVIEILRACKSPAHAGPNGRTILHAAVIGHDPEIVREILKVKRAGLTKEADQQGWTPLHYVARLGYSCMVELLLKDDISAAYDVEGRDGKKIALHIAAHHGNYGVVSKLISYCPNCCELVDKRGYNFLHFAVESGNIWIVNLVLEDHNFPRYLLNEKDNEGNTPLHLLAYHNGLGIVDDSYSYSSASDFIRHSKVDKMALNKKNLSPLDIICANTTSNEKWKRHVTKKLLRADAKSDHITCDDAHERPNQDKYLEEMKQAKETHIVVAALIATVAFAASFTMPGGYISDDKNPGQQGTAALVTEPAFKAFVMSNTVAMALSSSAVFIYIFLAMPLGNERQFKSNFKVAAYLTIFATGAMVVAFMTGQYAVLRHSLWLAIITCVIASSLFFFFYYKLFLKSYGDTSLRNLIRKPIRAFLDLCEKASVPFKILLAVACGPFVLLICAAVSFILLPNILYEKIKRCSRNAA